MFARTSIFTVNNIPQTIAPTTITIATAVTNFRDQISVMHDIQFRVIFSQFSLRHG